MKKLGITALILLIISIVFILANSNFNYAKTFGTHLFPKNLTILKFDVPSHLYLRVGEKKELNVTVEELDGNEVAIEFISSDQNILSTKSNILNAKKEGTVTLTVLAENNEKKEITVVVTDLIQEPKVNNDKPYITCNEYTNEEEKLLDEILINRIEEAGYNTRAGALAAARFLILEFKNGIKYFNENGRLENHSSIKKIDGEGRFYHKGLYLTEEKFNEIEYSTATGPAPWGCKIKNIHYGKYMENGLNCSGFITWVLFNAGYDIKDVGAGDYSYINNELLDIEPKEKITEELLESEKVKVGDLIGFDGHIAMIIGISKNKIYIGESYETGLRVRTFTKNELIESEFTDIILMDDYYKEEGNYTNMW